MTPERWQKVEEVLQAALDLPHTERAALLAEACAGDPELQQETSSLIDAHEEAGEFMEQPALEQDAYLLIGDDEDGRIGDEIGPYKIVKRLGRGGMGEVYLAGDQRLGRLVALKILPPYFVSDVARLRRFQTEARAASALNHTNILTIYEVGQAEDIYFIAAEYIEGKTIRELIQSESLSLGEVVDIASQLVSGLSVAHAAGIIHRDVKPENVMQRNDGAVRILDFGIAKLIEGPASEVSTMTLSGTTQTGAVLGTVGYISPEQVRGLPVNERTDIWSSGVVLYEMLTGQRPFKGVTNADIIVSILERSPTPLFQNDLKATALRLLQQIVDKALRKNADERYQTAAEMLEDLNAVKRHLEGGLDKKRQPVNAQTCIKDVQSLASNYVSSMRPRLLIPAIVMSLLLLVGGVFVYRQWRPGARRTAAPPATQKSYAQMTEAEQLNFVSDQEQRISAMMGERPVKLNDEALRAIKNIVDRYAAPRPPDRDTLPAVYERATPYIPVIARAFEGRRIPIVVGIYLAMVESAYRPCAESSFGAKGLFQFLPQTAEQYGLARADMCDVNKMAPAAAHYIADHMAELGDDSQSMTLVLLSYNRGAQSVRDALRQLRETDQNYERNFWTLFANRDKLDATFREESAVYVPAFFAAAIIGENPSAFGLTTPPLSSLAR